MIAPDPLSRESVRYAEALETFSRAGAPKLTLRPLRVESNESVRKTVGRILLMLRLMNGLRQREIVASLDWSQSALSKAEAGLLLPNLHQWSLFCEQFWLKPECYRIPQEVQRIEERYIEWLEGRYSLKLAGTRGKLDISSPEAPVSRVKNQSKEPRERGLKWREAFRLLSAYRQEHPRQWPHSAESYQGFALGAWCRQQVYQNNAGKLASHCIDRLAEIDFPLNEPMLPKVWMRNFELLIRYRAAHPDRWPVQRTYYEGHNLGAWFVRMVRSYRAGTLEPAKLARIRSMGFRFEDPDKLLWLGHYNRLRRFIRKKGRLPEPSDGKRFASLIHWWHRQSTRANCGLLSTERMKLLDQLGAPWTNRRTPRRAAAAQGEEANRKTRLRIVRRNEDQAQNKPSPPLEREKKAA